MRGSRSRVRSVFLGLMVCVLFALCVAVRAGYAGQKGNGGKSDAPALVSKEPGDLEQRARQGNAVAQRDLGCRYLGHGVSSDDRKALKWFRKAAAQGDMHARNNLGFMYRNGRGVAKDDRKAVQWFRKAATQGLAGAQCNLGIMYVCGFGVAQNDSKAVEWFQKAADQGIATAQNNLGEMYENGRGVAKDETKALELYRKAAEQGNEEAKKTLKRFAEAESSAKHSAEAAPAATSDADFIELCGQGSAQQIIAALKYGANMNARDKDGRTALAWAAQENSDPDAITALIKAGLDVNAKWGEWTPLMLAVGSVGSGYDYDKDGRQQQEVATALLKAGADVNARTKDGRTPLMLAVPIGRPAVISTLLKFGAKIDAKDERGATPLEHAAVNPYLEVIKALVDAGADVNAKDLSGWTPLMRVAWGSPIPGEAIMTLVKAGADVDARDKTGKTPLMWAADGMRTADWEGESARARSSKAVVTLLGLGADPKAKDNSGKMAIDYARENKDLKDTVALKRLEEVSR